jgi:aminoglycoside/choline kinase family phosphotransferase
VIVSSIVSSSDELTPEWFTLALGDHGSTVTDVRLKPLGGGAMCRMLRASLTWDGSAGGPESVIVKFPTADASTLALAMAMRMYELEVRFYRDLVPHLTGLRVATCHLAELEEATGAFTLVLEDLSERSRPGDVLQESSNDECSAVLAELAHLQGTSWNSTTISAMPWLADPERTIQLFDSMPAGLEPWLARFGHALEPEQVALFEAVIPQAGKWIRSWAGPSVVQHGDLRTDNILFSLDPVPRATLLDFQTIRLGPPGMDPAYFLGSSLSTETRRTAERALLAEFHDRLTATGVTDYDFDACFRAYREGALYAVYLFCGLSSRVASSERVDRVIADQTRRYADMALDLEAPQLAGLV